MIGRCLLRKKDARLKRRFFPCLRHSVTEDSNCETIQNAPYPGAFPAIPWSLKAWSGMSVRGRMIYVPGMIGRWGFRYSAK